MAKKRFKKLEIFLLCLLVIFAFLVRFYRISEVPANLYYDEVDYGYQARSLIETGKDYRGSFSPFYVHSFNDIRLPIPAYFTVLTTLLFDMPELEVRMPFVLSGTAVVLFIFLLVRIWSGQFLPSFVAALVFATNPWQIQFSRFSHEAMVMMLFYTGGLLLFFKALRQKTFLLLLFAVIVLSFAVYTMRTMSFYIPVTFAVLSFLYRRDLIRFGIKKISLLFVIAGFIIIPFLYSTTLGAPDIPRINQLAIMSDPETPIWVQRNREVDSGDYSDDTLGKKAVWYSYIFHSKPISWLDDFTNNYFQSFSAEFLFLSGDPNLRHHVGNMGHLFFIDVVGLLFGIFYMRQNFKQKYIKWLLFWVLTAPVSASLTLDGAKHASRLFIFSAPLLITISFGWMHFFQIVRNIKFGRILLSLSIFTWFLLFVFYLHRYFTHYPVESARAFSYGYKQAMLAISGEQEKYKKIFMVPIPDPPMIYYLFWSKTDPKLLQEYGAQFSIDIIKNRPLDKYKVGNFLFELSDQIKAAESMQKDALYMVTQNELRRDLRGDVSPPKGVRLLKIITYPDNEVAFYLVSRDLKYKPE